MSEAQNLAFAGLGTVTVTSGIAGPYFVEGKLALPTLTNGGGESECLVTIVQNSSTVYTGTAGADGFKTELLCTANEDIAITLSSSASADQGLNAIKSVISFGLGE